LVNKLGQDIISLIWTVWDKLRAIIPKHFRQCGSFLNIVTKFDDDPMKNIWVAEQTRLILSIWANSRAITP